MSRKNNVLKPKDKKNENKQYWQAVQKAKWHEVILFFVLIYIGYLIYEFTDFVTIRWISAQIASFWVKIFGFYGSTVVCFDMNVYVYPLGIETPQIIEFIKGCTPAAGFFPLICMFSVPRTKWRIKLRNFLIYAVTLFFVMELINGYEIALFASGIPWEQAHNFELNSLFTYCLSFISLTIILFAWPEFSIPFIFFIKLSLNRIKAWNQKKRKLDAEDKP
nr:hypothetical protein [Candidatus Sigynarchaeota archaeon]